MPSKTATLRSPTRSRNGKQQHLPTDPWTQIQDRADLSGDRYALFHGDATKRLLELPESSVDTCLTSPPYWSVRDYQSDDQIGLEETVEDYIQRLVDVFRGVRRALRDDGTAWLNLGDIYINGPRQGTAKWQKSKQLALVPFRVAIALQDDGWWVRNSMVWSKPNAMPASVSDRLSNSWEPVFLLTKKEKYYFDLDAVRVPHKTDDQVERKRAQAGNAEGKAKGNDDLRRWLNSPRHRATIEGLREVRRRPNAPQPVELAAYLRDAMKRKGISVASLAEVLGQPFERVRHYVRTDVIGARLPPEATWMRLKEILDLDSSYDELMSIEVGDNVFRNHPNGRNPGDVQSFALTGGATDGHGHFALMPDSLATWCLQATLPAGGVCLDPFFGVGTTGRAALALGGKAIGVDVRRDYLTMAQTRLDPRVPGTKTSARGSRKKI